VLNSSILVAAVSIDNSSILVAAVSIDMSRRNSDNLVDYDHLKGNLFVLNVSLNSSVAPIFVMC
jgi:hypothetical protein